MKKLGLLGGMSWESTAVYYRKLNEGVRKRMGGFHSCPLILHSVDFAPFASNMNRNDWSTITADLIRAARSVEKGGADALVIATNTMHKAAPEVQDAIDIPLLHMAEAIARGAQKKNAVKLGLLGTSFTMEQDFISRPLKEKFGLEVFVPESKGRSFVHRTIFDELCCGKILEQTRAGYIELIDKLVGQGAEIIVLGCTEIGLLVRDGDVEVPLIDTVEAHVDLALEFVM